MRVAARRIRSPACCRAGCLHVRRAGLVGCMMRWIAGAPPVAAGPPPEARPTQGGIGWPFSRSEAIAGSRAWRFPSIPADDHGSGARVAPGCGHASAHRGRAGGLAGVGRRLDGGEVCSGRFPGTWRVVMRRGSIWRGDDSMALLARLMRFWRQLRQRPLESARGALCCVAGGSRKNLVHPPIVYPAFPSASQRRRIARI